MARDVSRRVSSPFFPPPPPLPLSTPLVAVVYNLINLSTKNINIEVKKQHTWGSRRIVSRAPIKCNKKKPPIEGGVVACGGGGGGGSVVVVFVLVMDQGGWVLWG